MYILLVIIALEFIDPFSFTFTVEGFPLSLAEVCFIFIGVRYFKIDILRNPVFIAIFVIFTGMMISAFFLDNAVDNISRTSAFLILVVSSYGFARYFIQEKMKTFLLILFLSTLVYWMYYVYQIYSTGNISFEYHFNSPFQETEAVNAHNIGLQMSISGIFLFTYLLYQRKLSHKILGFSILVISLIVCMFVYSRSNFIFISVVGIIVFFYKSGAQITLRSVINWSLVFGVGFLFYTLVFNYISSLGSGIEERFDASDTEYIETTTRGRTLVYGFFFDYIKTNFFGTGLVRTKFRIMQEGFKNLGMHNQYATFIVAGGWISGVGVLMLLRQMFLQFSSIFIRRRTTSILKTSILFTLLIYMITIATLEVGSLVFFIMLGILMNLKSNIIEYYPTNFHQIK